MKAALFYESGLPLRVEEIETPEVGPKEVLVRVAACGICRSDLSILEGYFLPSKRPIVLGHEASGVVAEVGEDVERSLVGDRVLIDLKAPCGKCYYCLDGRANLCLNPQILGLVIDGAFAEYVKVPETAIINLPKELHLEESAILVDAVSTPLHAIKNVASVSPRDVVAIYGIGGLGINAVQIAALYASKVIAVDVMDWKLEVVRKLGADEIINAREEDPVETIKGLTDGLGADIAFEISGDPEALDYAFWSVKSGGQVVVVGLGYENVDLNWISLVLREVIIKGSHGYTRKDLMEVLNLARIGSIKLSPVISHRLRLEDVNKGLELLEKETALRALVTP